MKSSMQPSKRHCIRSPKLRQALGARREEAKLLMVDIFAHAAGLLSAGPHRPHPDVWRLGSAPHGTFCPEHDRDVDRKAKEVNSV